MGAWLSMSWRKASLFGLLVTMSIAHAELKAETLASTPSSRAVSVGTGNVIINGTSPGLTQNQTSLASAIGQICSTTNSLALQAQCAKLELLTPAQQSSALAQLTPDQLAAQGSIAVQLVSVQRSNLSSRIAALKRGSSGLARNGQSIQVAGLEWPTGLLADATPTQTGMAVSGSGGLWADGRLGMFANGRVAFGAQDTTSNQAGFDFDSGGLTLGADYRYTEQIVLGGSLGYATTSSDFTAQRGDLSTDGLVLSFYGSYYTPKSYFLDWIASYGTSNYDTRRNIIYSGVNTSAQGSTDSRQLGISVNAGVDINRGVLLLSPYLRLEYSEIGVNGYTEQGGAGWALGYKDQTLRSLTTTLGGRASWALSQRWGVLTPGVTAEWDHQFKGDARRLTAHFAEDPSVPFTIRTDSLDRDYLNLGVSLAATLPGGKAVFVSYETVLGQQHATFSTINLGARMEF